MHKVANLGFEYREQLLAGALSRKLMFRFPRPFIDRPRDVQLTLESFATEGQPYGVLLVEDVGAVRSVERTKDFLVRLLAHDMNSPLTTIMGMFDLLQVPPESEKLLTSSQLAVEKLRDLIADLFDITRLEGVDVPSRIMPHNLVPLLRTATETSLVLAGVQGVRVVLDAPDTLPAPVDEHLVRRAVDNLLDNAIRLSPEGGQVTVQAGLEGEQVVISVEDQGPGIPENLRSTLFQSWVKSDSGGGDLAHHGLGLALVDLVAREHGGTISVRCPPSGGSVFTLHLPLVIPKLVRDSADQDVHSREGENSE